MLDAKNARELTRCFAKLKRRKGMKTAPDFALPRIPAYAALLSQCAAALGDDDYYHRFAEWMLETEIVQATRRGRNDWRINLDSMNWRDRLCDFERIHGIAGYGVMISTIRETNKWAIRLLNELGYSVIALKSNAPFLAAGARAKKGYWLGYDEIHVEWDNLVLAASKRRNAKKASGGEPVNA